MRLQRQLVRVLQVMRYIEQAPKPPALGLLARQFRVHPRTIKRDLAALHAAGVLKRHG